MNKNAFAKTPPMGWNSYDFYDTTVNEEEIKKNAEYMAANLKVFGWEYIVADIQWYAYDTGSRRSEYQYIPFGKVEMDQYGRLIPCPDRFPSSKGGMGFKPLADYVHKLGLKFGIHIMRGIPRIAAQNKMPILYTDCTADKIADPSSICNWNPDMYGILDNENGQAYYDSLIEMYSDWGVDFIKCDDICNLHASDKYPDGGKEEIKMLHKAIIKSKRPIVLSLSPGPALTKLASCYEKYSNMWRISDDFWDDWKALRKMFDYCETWQYYVSEGCYPDCDMLPVGKIGRGFGKERMTNFTKAEQQTMMSLWCLFRSPLMLGAEMTQLDEGTFDLLTNTDVLELLSEGYKPKQIRKDNGHAVWISDHLEKGNMYIALFNFGEREERISIEIEEINQMSRIIVPMNNCMTEVWKKEDYAMKGGLMDTVVEAHGVKLYKVSPGQV